MAAEPARRRSAGVAIGSLLQKSRRSRAGLDDAKVTVMASPLGASAYAAAADEIVRDGGEGNMRIDAGVPVAGKVLSDGEHPGHLLFPLSEK